MEYCGGFLPASSNSTLPLLALRSVEKLQSRGPLGQTACLAGLPLQPPCCTQHYTDLLSQASPWPCLKKGLFPRMLASHENSPPVGPAIGIQGMPRFAESWDEHNLFSQAGTRYFCFCASLTYLSQAFKLFSPFSFSFFQKNKIHRCGFVFLIQSMILFFFNRRI